MSGSGPPGDAARFRRGLDGRIYHYPPMLERLAALRSRFALSIGAVALMVTLPLGAVILGLALIIGFAGGGLETGALLIAGMLALGSATAVYFMLQNFFVSKLEQLRRQALYRLLSSELPVLIAEESSWQRVRDQTAGVPQLRWLGLPTLGKFEECLLFAAAYFDVIEGFSRDPEASNAAKLRHGSCLHWLSTASGAAAGWITAGSCLLPYLNTVTWFMLVPLIVGANRYVELAGNLTAICDYFLLGAEDLETERKKYAAGLKPPAPTKTYARPSDFDTLADIQRRAGEEEGN